MLQFKVLGLALVAVFAFAVASAASASAEVALWNANGVEVKENLASDTEGLLNLIVDTILGDVNVHCEGIFDGTVGAGGVDEITALLNLAGEEISKTALSGLALDCSVVSAAILCKAGELAEVWPAHLPWVTQLELSGTTITDRLGFKSAAGNHPGYAVFCATEGSQETCEGNPLATLTNNATLGDVTSVFANQKPEGSKCGNSLAEGLIEGEGLILLTNGEPLTVSDP